MRLRTLLFVVVSASCWGKSLSIPKEVIEEVKTTLLPMFGITETPKLDGVQVHVPEVLKKLYDIQNDLDYDTASLPVTGIDTGSANTVRSFIHIESPVDQKFTRSNRFRLKFNVSTIPPTEILKAAEVKLTRAVVEDPVENHPYQRILMHDILRPGVKGVRAPITRVIDSKMIDTRKNSTVSLDVYPAVKRWMEVPKHNHGVLVTVTTAGDKKTPAKPHLRLRRESDPSNWARSQPLLLTT
ncbi:hypothetical protein GEV33_003549 [Tenebrio molitor]|uniref:TGF-beta propeptide domain-containing protein n=1 Tax=Tenebrio molitor TaxID=7067 RepID=A0A8J6HPN7_TENMO|nr:hypothetical protein GEV33_003549 [Tenebrio molitor]